MTLPNAIERKNRATTCALNAVGANFVDNESPTGEMSNSAKVKPSSMMASITGDALCVPLPAIGKKAK
ncbi:hypothetical protein D3C81_2178760 [compost metagenome]